MRMISRYCQFPIAKYWWNSIFSSKSLLWEKYLKNARKKLKRLKRATELFTEIQPEISSHTNFQMTTSCISDKSQALPPSPTPRVRVTSDATSCYTLKPKNPEDPDLDVSLSSEVFDEHFTTQTHGSYQFRETSNCHVATLMVALMVATVVSNKQTGSSLYGVSSWCTVVTSPNTAYL